MEARGYVHKRQKTQGSFSRVHRQDRKNDGDTNELDRDTHEQRENAPSCSCN